MHDEVRYRGTVRTENDRTCFSVRYYRDIGLQSRVCVLWVLRAGVVRRIEGRELRFVKTVATGDNNLQSLLHQSDFREGSALEAIGSAASAVLFEWTVPRALSHEKCAQYEVDGLIFRVCNKIASQRCKFSMTSGEICTVFATTSRKEEAALRRSCG